MVSAADTEKIVIFYQLISGKNPGSGFLVFGQILLKYKFLSVCQFLGYFFFVFAAYPT
jgi:hypothetical protein